MAGRPKIQFTDAQGQEARELLRVIIDHREEQDRIAARLHARGYQGIGARIHITDQHISEGAMVLQLLREEADRRGLNVFPEIRTGGANAKGITS